MCGWNSTARDLIDELQGDDYKQKVVVLADLDKNPAGSRRLLRPRRRDQRRGPRAGRDRGRLGRPRLPGRRLGRGRHALDPDDHGHRVGRARRPDRGRGQQPAPRAALPAGQRRRAAGHLQGRLASARAVGALPGPVRRSSPTSCPAARAPSSTGSRCPTSTSACRSTTVATRLRNDHQATLLSVNRGGHAFVNPPDRLRAPGRRRRDRRGRGPRHARAAPDARHHRPRRGPPRWCPAPDPASGGWRGRARAP